MLRVIIIRTILLVQSKRIIIIIIIKLNEHTLRLVHHYHYQKWRNFHSLTTPLHRKYQHRLPLIHSHLAQSLHYHFDFDIHHNLKK